MRVKQQLNPGGAAARAFPLGRHAPARVLLLLSAALIALLVFSCTLGRYAAPLPELLRMVCAALAGQAQTGPAATVLFDVRLPRIACAVLVGAGLAASGAAYQGVFKNPMASPDLLGASAGAGFGAALAILAGWSAAGLGVSAFLFGIGAVLVTLLVSHLIGKGSRSLMLLVLTGMVTQSLFLAFTSGAKYVADPNNKLPAITFWLMGGLSTATQKQAVLLLIPFAVGVVPMFLFRWRMNTLSFGEEEAQAMGINVRLFRLLFIFAATLLASSSVAVAGMVGWVGLIVPHLARWIVGPDFRHVLPASLLTGGIFLLAVDDIARAAFPVEIPLGILTAVIGAPLFLHLLLRRKKRGRSSAT